MSKSVLITILQMSLLYLLFCLGGYALVFSENKAFSAIKALLFFAPYYFIWIVFALISFWKEGKVFIMISRANAAEAARNPDSDYNKDWNFKYSFPFFILCGLILFLQLQVFGEYFGF